MLTNTANIFFLFVLVSYSAVTKCHKRSCLKQHKFIASQFWKLNCSYLAILVLNCSYLAYIKLLAGLCYFQRFRGESIFLAGKESLLLLKDTGFLHSLPPSSKLTVEHLQISLSSLTSAFVITSPSLPLIALSPFPISTLVITWGPPRYSRTISPPEDSELNHICKVTFPYKLIYS